MTYRPIMLFSLIVLSLCGCHRTPRLSSLPGTAHPLYSITDIGVGMPHDVNNRGQIVGMFPAGVFPSSKGFPYLHGFLWNQGKRNEMPTLGGWYSNAGRINDQGQIIGSASVPGQNAHGLPIEHGCLWDGHTLKDLEADPRFRGTGAIHITKAGGVFAISPPQKPRAQLHLWFFPSGFGPGVRLDKGVIGGPGIQPIAINDAGMVIGRWDTGGVHSKTSVQRGFVWRIGQKKWTDLGTLGGNASEATALNNSGQIVGSADLPQNLQGHSFLRHAFLWEKGRMQDLGTLSGGDYSQAYALNNKGQIVGFSSINGSNLETHPVLWENRKIKDLTRLIPSNTKWESMEGAAGINDKGQIVGDGGTTDAKDHHAVSEGNGEGGIPVHGYLLTPLP